VPLEVDPQLVEQRLETSLAATVELSDRQDAVTAA
jgi:hypothetical protein